MNNQKDPKIANRESWLKVGVIGGFSALIAWKLLSAPIALDLSDFKFTDLLNGQVTRKGIDLLRSLVSSTRELL